jgi:predicted metal-dependent enzyme (double-stranded beta helix superfamily)
MRGPFLWERRYRLWSRKANMVVCMTSQLDPLNLFVAEMTKLLSVAQSEELILAEGKLLLGALVSNDGWLPSECAKPLPGRYGQYLLYCDPQDRFSVVSLVWGPGQSTPVHDHTVWGLVGVLRGAERCDEFELRDGQVHDLDDAHIMTPGQVEAVSPTIGDWHRVSNASDGASISIHVYGGNIGKIRRHRLDERGQIIDFVSGYENVAR